MKHNSIFACVHCDSSFSEYTGRILDHHSEITCLRRPFDDNPLMGNTKGFKKSERESVPNWFLNTKKHFDTKFFGITSIARDALDMNFFKTGILIMRHPLCSWLIQRMNALPKDGSLTLSACHIEEFSKYCSANMPSILYWLHHSNLVIYYQDLLKEPTKMFNEIYKTIGAAEVMFLDDVKLPYDNPFEKINNPEMIHVFLMNFPYKAQIPQDLELV